MYQISVHPVTAGRVIVVITCHSFTDYMIFRLFISTWGHRASVRTCHRTVRPGSSPLPFVVLYGCETRYLKKPFTIHQLSISDVFCWTISVVFTLSGDLFSSIRHLQQERPSCDSLSRQLIVLSGTYYKVFKK